MQLRSLCTALAGILFSTLAAAAPSGPPQIIGEASDPDSGEIIYREMHYCSTDALLCTVFYEDETGQPIARKQLDYSRDLLAPTLHVEDYLQQQEFSAGPQDYAEGVVVDAGFDNFIRLQWKAIAAGDSVKFPLLIAGRDKPLPMRAASDPRGICQETQLCVQVRLDSWLLGKLVPPIDLTYERGSQRLLRYRGISNISDARGRTPRVDISYRYSHHSGNREHQPGSP